MKSKARRANEAMAQRLGFIQDGRLRHARQNADGTPGGALIFSLIPTDPRWPHG